MSTALENRFRVLALGAAVVAALLLTTGCTSVSWDLGYYWQSVRGHWKVINAAEPIDRLLATPTSEARAASAGDGSSLDPQLRQWLELARSIRRFATEALALPDNGSFTRYADLKRRFVVWNVVAAPRYSLQLQRWCFPVAGCISYRGYYDEQAAESFAQSLQAQGFDVYVAGVPAYSTLGWFDDPLLNTFIHYPEAELARLIFHELAHQVVYVKGDSTFNESFATAVEEIGVARWLAVRGDPSLTEAYRRYKARRQDFLQLLKSTRERLAKAYEEAADDAAKQQAKDQVFAALQRDYRALKESWGGFAGYDRWFSQKLGNAHLGSVATYTDLVEGFMREAQAQPDLTSFYSRVREIAKLDKRERDRLLGP